LLEAGPIGGRGARLGEGDGQVDTDGALADAALAGRDSDDVLDTGHELLRLRRRGASDGRAPGDDDGFDAERRQYSAGVRLDLILERTGRCRQLDREGHRRSVDPKILDHLAADQVARQFGFADLAEGVEDGDFTDRGHGLASPRQARALAATRCW